MAPEAEQHLNQSQDAVLDTASKMNEVKNLLDNMQKNPDARKNFVEELTKSVEWILNSLDDDTKVKLTNSVMEIFNKHQGEEWFDSVKAWLLSIGNILWLKERDWKLVQTQVDTQTDVADDTSKIELPTSPLKWKLERITQVERKDWDPENKKWEQNFYKWKNETVWIYEVATEWEKSELDKTIWDLKWQIVKLDAIDESKLSEEDKNKIEQLKNVLWNMNDAINNTTPENVVILQSFISENLSWTDEWTKFDQASKKKDGEFDWKFWVGTLAWLNKVLEKTWEYIDKLSEAFNQKKIDAIVEKKDVSIGVGWKIDPESLVEWLPQEWVSVVLSEWQIIDTSNAWPINVNVDVKLWDKTRKTLLVTVNVINSSTTEQDSDDSAEQSRKQPVTQPLSVDGKQYLPMENKPSSYPEWAVFYSAKAYSPKITSEEGSDSQSTEVQPKFTNVTETAEGDGDSIYLMRIGENVYKVKVDGKWNICPTAINAVSNVPVVMENSASGRAYIENKLPSVLRWKCSIWWDWEDYAIYLPWWWKYLTVEPMTIDWKRVWNLTDSLAFLNLTNYLRNSWKMNDIEFKNDNPDLKLEWNDLYVRVKKTRNVEWKKIKWLKVNKDTFWLPNDEKLLKKYIKYNNGEDWEDDWDKKKPNKYYKHVKLQ